MNGPFKGTFHNLFISRTFRWGVRREGGGDNSPRPLYILSLNIILFRFHDAGSVRRFMYCMKFTSEGNQENHEVLFQEKKKMELWSTLQ